MSTLLVFLLSAAVAIFGFSISQYFSVKRGQIPPYGTQIWKGRKFMFWTQYKTLLVGDVVFLSAINALVAYSLLENIFVIKAHAIIYCSVLSGLLTVFWLKGTKKAFATNKLGNRWDWHFIPPDAQLTFGGKFHTAYFFVETLVVLLAIYLCTLEGSSYIKIGILISLFAYTCAVAYDNFSVGMYLGPFSFWTVRTKQGPEI